MKLLGVFLLLPAWMDADPSQDYLPPAYVHLDEGKHYEMSGVGRTDHNATDPEWKVPSASKYRDTAYLFGVQGTSVFVHLFHKGKVTLARLLQTAVNTDHVKETSLI